MADDGACLADGDPWGGLAGAALFHYPIRVVDDVLVTLAIEVPSGAGEGQGFLGGPEATVANVIIAVLESNRLMPRMPLIARAGLSRTTDDGLGHRP
jgi:hypothetical protein